MDLDMQGGLRRLVERLVLVALWGLVPLVGGIALAAGTSAMTGTAITLAAAVAASVAAWTGPASPVARNTQAAALVCSVSALVTALTGTDPGSLGGTDPASAHELVVGWGDRSVAGVVGGTFSFA